MSNGSATKRLTYGANKYAAFHLLLCRWLRRYAQPVPYQYVTLGGTEFGDVRSLHFIDPTLLGHALSFEEKPNRFELAEATAESLRQAGVDIVVIDGNLFSSFARESADPHIFFVDLEGSCAFGELHKSFGALFRDQTIRENDCLLITSYLRPRGGAGWDRVYSTFDAFFRLLGVGTNAQKQEYYRRLHPSFTLYRALRFVDLQDELALTCFGGLAYRGYRSSMAVFGYVVDAGVTQLSDFVADVPWYIAAYEEAAG